MMRSLSSAVGGLRAHQTKMDVIGNNIANVNTYGFKSSRVTFNDVYYQTLSGAGAPGAITGGTNPTQIGYGAMVSTIDVLNSPSSGSATDRALDIYMSGDGMMAVRDANGNMKYTRLGALYFDADGNLVDGSGNFVMGFPMDNNGNAIVNPDGTVSIDSLTNIRVDPDVLDQLTGISISPNGEIQGVLPGESTATLSTGLPAWIAGLRIRDGSTAAGNVNMEAYWQAKHAENANMPADWITSIEMAKNSGTQTRGAYTYRFNYDADGTLTATNTTTNEVLTGKYTTASRGNAITMYNEAGEAVMYVNTDNYTTPSATGPLSNPVTFTEELYIGIKYTDKGGTVHEDATIYNGTTDSITFFSGQSYQVTVDLNPSEVGQKLSETLTLDLSKSGAVGGAVSNWLQSAGMNDILGRGGSVDVTYTNKMTSTGNAGTVNYQLGNCMDNDELEALLNAYAVATGEVSEYSFTIEEDPVNTGEYIVSIIDEQRSGAVVATANYDPGSTGNSLTLSHVGPPAATLTLNTTGWDDPTSGIREVEISIGSSSLSNVVGVTVSGQSVGEYTLRQNDTRITIGPITMNVDGAALATAIGLLGRNASETVNIGTLTSTMIDDWEIDKKIGSADPGEGETITIGVIALATFGNVSGLAQDGTSYFSQTANSGDPTFTRPGLNGTGAIKAGYLEMSNVDISKEFTDMITTQRGFQANTRIITVSDEMLQELVNLKR